MNPKTIKILLFFLFVLNLNLQAQNLFDKPHSLVFTKYLFDSRQYKFASIELEKLVFFDSKNDSLKARLIESYRLSGFHEKGILRTKQMFVDIASIPQKPTIEFAKLLLSDKRFSETKILLESNKHLSNIYKIKFGTELNLLTANWTDVNLMIEKYADSVKVISKYRMVVTEALAFKRKRPWLAASLSAIIPGTGKIYTTYWKDGLFTFAGIGISAWQAYDGFSTDGIKSVYGWIFGGVAAVLYFSNIYGAAKSARKYNLDNEKKLIHKAELIMGNY